MKNQEQNTPKSVRQPQQVENICRTEKLCAKCHNIKPVEHFYWKKTISCYSSFCKECIKENQRHYNKSKKDLISLKKCEYWNDNKEIIKARRKNHKVDLERKRASRRKWETARLSSDIQYKLSKNLRKRIFNALKKQGKSARTEFLIGCSIDFLISFIESKFQPGMNWENYGRWHIDHIIPISSVDLTNQQELLRIMNYKNLQPLWAADNIRKGAKFEPQKQK